MLMFVMDDKKNIWKLKFYAFDFEIEIKNQRTLTNYLILFLLSVLDFIFD